MGTLLENQVVWDNYDWMQGGDEWSFLWGGTEFLWGGTIFPRIQACLPTEVILEIAPGFGRCTRYLKDYCRHLVIVDLTERCIDACRQRFSMCKHITYGVNDGKSLDIVRDRSVDFVFSFDSLVHAESDVLESYVHQLARKLKHNGIGFIHHSNIGAFVDPDTRKLPFENTHWRAETMTAHLFEQYCNNAGLQCIGQELINWGGGEHLIDCFSLFTLSDSITYPRICIENRNFMDEPARLSTLAQLYSPQRFQRITSTPPAPSSLVKKSLMTLRRSGPRGLAVETMRYLLWRLER